LADHYALGDRRALAGALKGGAVNEWLLAFVTLGWLH
jgi:hypothetical protein